MFMKMMKIVNGVMKIITGVVFNLFVKLKKDK